MSDFQIPARDLLGNPSLAVQPEEDIEQRLRACDKAIEADPRNAGLHSLKGDLLKSLGRYAEAEVCFRNALRLKPTAAKVLTSLAFVLRHQGRIVAAARALKEAVDLVEDQDDWREQLVGLLLAGRRYGEAARQIAALVERNPRPELAPLLTRAMEGMARDAEDDISPSLRASFEQAAESLREGRPAETEAAILAVVEQRPRWAEAWILLRGARYAQRFFAEAEATNAEWRAAARSDHAVIEVTAARRMSARGLLFDPREPLLLQPKAEVLAEVHSRNELASHDNSCLVIDPGGAPVRYEAILSVEEDGADRFVVETETSESFVAAFRNAALVGRGLVVTEQNTVVIETMIPHPEKYLAEIRDRRLWFDVARYADGAMPVRCWDQPAFLMAGPTDMSFGDWIWKFPPRLTLARAAGLDLPLVVNSHLPHRYLELLELLGFDRSRLLFHDPDGVSVFRKLFVPSWPSGDRLRPMKGWNRVYEQLARKGMKRWLKAADKSAASPDRPLLYLARTKVRQRALTNESEVIELFASRGFQVICPEELSWRDLLKTFACPAVVAGPYGSALRNMAFCHEKPLSLVLMHPCDETFLRGTAVWLAEFGVQFAYVRGRPASGEEASKPRKASWSVDVSKVEHALDRLLLVDRRTQHNNP